MITALITGIVGIAMLVAVLGFMGVWVKAIPLINRCWWSPADLRFVQTLRAGDGA
jgi:hypothetical protein